MAPARVKNRSVVTYDVTLLEGSPYRRLVARNDQPLPPEEEKKEEEKLRRSIEERSKETPEEKKRAPGRSGSEAESHARRASARFPTPSISPWPAKTG